MSSSKWDKRFIGLAEHVAEWSLDPHVKVGAVLVNTDDTREFYTGYNGFPRGIKDTEERYQDKKQKHELVVHAELNAIFNAQAKLDNFTLYCTRFPCSKCFLAILQSGIKRVVAYVPSEDDINKHQEDYSLVLMCASETSIEMDIRTPVTLDSVLSSFIRRLYNHDKQAYKYDKQTHTKTKR